MRLSRKLIRNCCSFLTVSYSTMSRSPTLTSLEFSIRIPCRPRTSINHDLISSVWRHLRFLAESECYCTCHVVSQVFGDRHGRPDLPICGQGLPSWAERHRSHASASVRILNGGHGWSDLLAGKHVP